MNLSTILGALARRWYVTLVLVVATGLVATSLWGRAESTYTTSTTISVIASATLLADQQSDDATVIVTNPYAQQSSTLAALLADTVAFGNVPLPPEAEDAVLTTSIDTIRAQTFFTVTATADSRDAALAAVRAMEDAGPELLADIQTRAGTSPTQFFTAILARPAIEPIESTGDRLRVGLGAALGGLLLTALVVVALDGSLAERSRRAPRSRQVNAPAVETEVVEARDEDEPTPTSPSSR